MTIFAIGLVAYLTVGCVMCWMLWMQEKPGHWLNYPLLILGWPLIVAHVARKARQ